MLFLAFTVVFLLLWSIVYAILPTVRHLGRMIALFIARSAPVSRVISTTQARYGDYLPVLAILVAGVFLTAWTGDGFLDLAERVHAKNSRLEQLDTSVHDWAIGERTPGATVFFVLMTYLGSPAGIAIVTFIVSISLAIRRRWPWILYLIVTAGGGGLLNLELKLYFARARPAVAGMLRSANGYSFPSGHAMGSAVVFGALAYLAFRAIGSWPVRAAVLAFLYTLLAAIALSRVYLGVHWISDVLAGVSAGTVWVTATTVAYETTRRMARLRRALSVVRANELHPRENRSD